MSDTGNRGRDRCRHQARRPGGHIERHRRFQLNTLPALVTVGPVTLWLLAFIAAAALHP